MICRGREITNLDRIYQRSASCRATRPHSAGGGKDAAAAYHPRYNYKISEFILTGDNRALHLMLAITVSVSTICIAMQKFRLLITDLTNYGTLRCVAGWDLDRNAMVRPEPSPAGFWQQTACGRGKPFAPGNIVALEAALPSPRTDLPHLNEDRVVKSAIALERTLAGDEFVAALKATNVVDRKSAFAAPVKIENGKAYVERGTNHPSLRGLQLNSDHLSFISEHFGDKPEKLRVLIQLPNSATLNLSVAANDLRNAFQRAGLKGIKGLFAGSRNLHVRLGLARGFGQFPDRCYMQVNGIYALD